MEVPGNGLFFQEPAHRSAQHGEINRILWVVNHQVFGRLWYYSIVSISVTAGVYSDFQWKSDTVIHLRCTATHYVNSHPGTG
jgi:hypothetical protein